MNIYLVVLGMSEPKTKIENSENLTILTHRASSVGKYDRDLLAFKEMGMRIGGWLYPLLD